MLKLSRWTDDGHKYLKCKRCKQEFYVVSTAYYSKSINFCPYCGERAIPWKHYQEKEDDEFER